MGGKKPQGSWCYSAEWCAVLPWSQLDCRVLCTSFAGLNNPVVTLYYLAPVMAASLGLLSLCTEPLLSLGSTPYFDTRHHALRSVGLMLFGGCLAFCMVRGLTQICNWKAVVLNPDGHCRPGCWGAPPSSRKWRVLRFGSYVHAYLKVFIARRPPVRLSLILCDDRCLTPLQIMAEFMLISETSAITLTIAGVCKEVVTIVVS